jgi:hypothetical protein
MYTLLGGIPSYFGETEVKILNVNKIFLLLLSKRLIRRLLEPKKQYRIRANEALRYQQ